MRFDEALDELKKKPKGFISRLDNKLNGVKLFWESGDWINAKVQIKSFPFNYVPEHTFVLDLKSLQANDWYFDYPDSLPKYGPDVTKRNPASDNYLTSPVYAGRFIGPGRKNKYVYLDMSRIEHLPEHVDEGDLIERGWMKAEPDFQGASYCRFCGASLKDMQTGYLTSTCPKCGEYNCYADFQMCVSC